MHMRKRMLWITTALTLAMVVAVSMAVLVAQTKSGTKALPKTTTDTEAAIKAAADAFKKETELKTYTVPKTPWGEPDLRGVWNTATYTRLQRPEELGNKAFFTEEEAIAEYKKAAESDAEVDPRPAVPGLVGAELRGEVGEDRLEDLATVLAAEVGADVRVGHALDEGEQARR